MSPQWRIIALPDATEIPSVVVEAWLGAYKKSPWAGAVANNVFRAVYAETIRQLVARGSVVLLAVNPAKPDHILGFLCFEYTRDNVPVVHMCFVKDWARKHGVAKSLLAAAGIDPSARFFYTFKTGQEKYFPGGKYAPEIARRKQA